MSAHVVLVDLQRVFAEPSSPWASPGFDRVLAPSRALVEAAGAGRVTFTRFLPPRRPAGAWVDYYAQWPFALTDPADAMWDLVEGVADLAADLAAGAGGGSRATLDATTFGKWGEDLAARTAGADELLVAGVSTDCCVLSTVLAAADAGRRVRVVADACAGADDAAHARALDAMALYAPLVEVTTSARALAQLARSA